MSRSRREIGFPRVDGVFLVSVGIPIPDLHRSDRINGRKYDYGYLIASIGMDFGNISFRLTINWVLWFDLSRSIIYWQRLGKEIATDLVLISVGLMQIGIMPSLTQPVDLTRFYLRGFPDSFLLLFLWRILRAKALSSGIDMISILWRFESSKIWLIWKFRVFKGRGRGVNRHQLSLLPIIYSLLSYLIIPLSGLWGLSLLSLLSSSLCVSMPQSSMLGKESVEKALGAAVSKMRIKIPSFDNSALIKGYAKTMIGRCMNPRKQDMKGLLLMFPRICQVEGRVAGADLGLGRFQIDFDDEEDITEVLKMEPFHFDGWMVSLVRWKPSVDPTYPSSLTFWVRVLGIPIEYWADPTFQSIGDALGKVIEVDLDGGRVQVILDGFKPLCFETIIEFDSGETLVSLRYERLYGYCSYCFSMCHDVEHCEKKYGIRNPPSQPMAGSAGTGAHNWSYKGAVVQDRLPKHGSEGKGKGIVSGNDREEERIEPSNSKAIGFGKGKQSRFTQGEGSARYKRFSNYAQFNEHRFNEQKKMKAKDKEVTKVKVVESTELKVGPAEVFKPKKIVRKSLVFEEETGGSSGQPMESKEQTNVEDQAAAQDDPEMDELNLEGTGAVDESGRDPTEEAAMFGENMDLELEDGNVSDSAVLPSLEQLKSVLGEDAFVSFEEVMESVEEADIMGIVAAEGAEAAKLKDKGKGKEGSMAKKKPGRGLVLPGVTTRKRMVQALVSPRKRPAPKKGPSPGDDNFPPNQEPENGGSGGSQPPQPSA